MISNVVQEFLDILRKKIENADVDNALGLARLYGNIAWNNPVGVYHARDIEDKIYEKLDHVRSDIVIASDRSVSGKILHVLTEGYTSGGHTRVVERLVTSTASSFNQDVVIVEICPMTVVKKLAHAGSPVKRIKCTGMSAIAEIAALMTQYESVILHIHPDDIVSSMAARIARSKGTKIAFYNHADHCFTFGIESANVLCEISAYGRAVSEKYRTRMIWTFSGIPLDVGYMSPTPRVIADYVLSSGPAYKFDFNEGGIFSSIVNGVLSDTTRKMIIIGPGQLPSHACKTLTAFVNDGRLVIMPQISHQSYIGYLSSCLCYLDSAPLTGGSALPEAALRGIPCAGLVNPVMGYSPIDAIRSNSVAGLVKRIRNFCCDADDDPESRREQLMFAHSPVRVLDRILGSLATGTTIDVPSAMQNEAIDIGYIQEQWEQKGKVNIHTRAFDYISISQRIVLAILMARHKIFSAMRAIDIVKILISNFHMRELRNRRSA